MKYMGYCNWIRLPFIPRSDRDAQGHHWVGKYWPEEQHEIKVFFYLHATVISKEYSNPTRTMDRIKVFLEYVVHISRIITQCINRDEWIILRILGIYESGEERELELILHPVIEEPGRGDQIILQRFFSFSSDDPHNCTLQFVCVFCFCAWDEVWDTPTQLHLFFHSHVFVYVCIWDK